MFRKKLLRFGAPLFILLLSLAVVLPIAVRAQNAVQTPHTWDVQVASEAGFEGQQRAIQGMAFLPRDVWVNQGDTVDWTVKSGDIHTVTFLAAGQSLPGFDLNDTNQTFPQGSSHYDGVSYHNSGILSDFPNLALPGGIPVFTSYSLTFDVPGNFVYYCLVHGAMMTGVVHVQPAGSVYPYTQKDYDRQIERAENSFTALGKKLAESEERQSSDLNVTVGAGSGPVGVMRFFPNVIKIHVGDSVTFTNRSPMDPHTVSFGPEGNIFVPYGDPTHFDGSAPLNSGILATGSPFGKVFKVTFTKAGAFDFFCSLHDFLGMTLKVYVLK